jgi:hypothetical protein
MAISKQLKLNHKTPFRRRDQAGQALVEFAFTVPIIVLLLVAVVGFAFFLYFFVTLNSCAREGARYTIGHPQAPNSEVSDYVKNGAGILNKNLMAVDVTAPADRSREAQITVRVSYPFQIMNLTIPYVIAPGSVTLFPPYTFVVVSTMNMD